MSDNSDLISILMPTYNVEAYVAEALESLLNQTYENIEIIIVDDCSTDGTYSILSEFADRDSRIKLYRNPSNSKIAYSLNNALERARGEFIARMDGDDLSVPSRIETLHDFLVNNEDSDLVGSYSAAMDSNGVVLANRAFPQSDRVIKKTLRYSSTIQHIWMARKSVYQRLGGYREFSGAEDYDFLLRAKQAGFGLRNCPEILYKVRLRDGNTESTKGLTRIKTKEYVYLHSLRGLPVDDLSVDESDLMSFLSHTEAEAESYRKASNLLNKAKHERGNKLLLIKDTLHAGILSKYMRRYIFETTRVRLAVIIERLRGARR